MAVVVRGFLALFGLTLILVGIYLAFGLAGDARANAQRAAAMAPLDASALGALSSGTPAMVEGALSQRNTARFGEFVAYVRQEFRGADNNGDEKWVVDETVLPPLMLEAGGEVRVANEGYELVGFHEQWQEEGLDWSSRTQEGTKRYYGLVAGRPVMAVGQVTAGSQGNVLVAAMVFGGTRDEYVAMQERNAGAFPWFGLLFGLVGAAAIFVGLWVLRRWR